MVNYFNIDVYLLVFLIFKIIYSLIHSDITYLVTGLAKDHLFVVSLPFMGTFHVSMSNVIVICK